jgi:sigma-E factor negative regulatory protein RseC
LDKTGTVIQTDNNTAVVEIMRANACGENCVMCKAACTTTHQTVNANNEIKATVGDMVRIEMSDKNVLLAAFFVYIVPVFTLITGYILIGWSGAVIGFVIPLLILKSLDKRLTKRYTATVTKIIRGSERI